MFQHIKFQYMHKSYLFRHWLFSWSVDKENDLVFSIAKRIHFLKYKEHTIVKFGKLELQAAPKYVFN